MPDPNFDLSIRYYDDAEYNEYFKKYLQELNSGEIDGDDTVPSEDKISWNDIVNKPTTLEGYGITDAAKANDNSQVITASSFVGNLHGNADTADEAVYAITADSANNATTAIKAELADLATNATTADNATKLSVARNINVTGIEADSVSFDGSVDVTINVTKVPASLIDGVIPAENLPETEEKTNVTVQDESALYELTTDDVKNGDTVFVSEPAPGKTYLVIDDTQLNNAAGYKEYTSDVSGKALADSEGNVITETYETKAHAVETFASKDELAALTETYATNEYVNETFATKEELAALDPDGSIDPNVVKYKEFGVDRKTIELPNYDSISGLKTDGTGVNLAMVSKWDKADFGSADITMNLNTIDVVTINDSETVATINDVNDAVSSATTSLEAKIEEKQDAGDYVLSSELDDALSSKADVVHTHVKADITDFPTDLATQADLADKADLIHTHVKADITDFPTKLSEFENDLDINSCVDNTKWNDIEDKPDYFPPTSHKHEVADIVDFPTDLVHESVLSEYVTRDEFENVDDSDVVKYSDVAGKKAIVLENTTAIAANMTTGETTNLALVNEFNDAEFGNTRLHTNIKTKDNVTINDTDIVATEAYVDNKISEKTDTLEEQIATKQDAGNYALSDDLNRAIVDMSEKIGSKQDIGDYATRAELNAGLDDKANVEHTHTVAQITDFPDLNVYATKSDVENSVKYKDFEENRKTIELANYDSVSGLKTDGTGVNLVMVSKWDKADFGSADITMNLNTIDHVTINDSDIVATIAELEEAKQILEEQIAAKQDAGNYATKDDLQSGLAEKQPIGNYATAEALQNGLAGKQPVGDYATNTALVSGLTTKQPVGDYATNTTLVSGLASKANLEHTHAVSDIINFPTDLVHENELTNYAPKEALNNYTPISALENFLTKDEFNDVNQSNVTETEMNSALSNKANIVHTHVKADITDFPTKLSQFENDLNIEAVTDIDWNNVQNKPASYPPAAHKHDASDIIGIPTDIEDAVTDEELNQALNNYLLKSETAVAAEKLNTARSISLSGVDADAASFDGTSDVVLNVKSVPASLISGVLGLNNIPAAAVNTIVTVADDSARFALTQNEVQTGDIVLVSDTDTMYLVIDDTKLSTSDGYREYAAGTASKALADAEGNIITETYETKAHAAETFAVKEEVNNALANKADAVHTHTVAQITDFPTDLVHEADLTEYATKEEVVAGDANSVKYKDFDENRKTIELANHNTISGLKTDGTGVNLAMVSKWDKADFGSADITMNLNTIDHVTINDEKVVVTEDVMNSALANKANAAHTHVKADITDFPTKLSEFENDLEPSEIGQVEWDNIQNKPESFTPSAHTHVVSDITDFPSDLVHEADIADFVTNEEISGNYATKAEIPTKLPNPESVVLRYNNREIINYDGSIYRTGDITVNVGNIPVAVTESGDATESVDFAANSMLKINAVGRYITTAESGVDYVVPNGNVASASKLETAHTINLSGVTSTAQVFDGTADVVIPITEVPYNIVTGAPTKLSQFENDLSAEEIGGVKWDAVTDKPDAFPPEAHTHVKADITDFPTDLATQTDLANKADLVHTHTKSQITDFPTKLSEFENDLPVIDTVVDWSEIENKPETFTPSAHTHVVSDITDFPDALPNPNALTIKYNNIQAFTYDGSSAETGNFTVTLGNIPAAVTDDGTPTTSNDLIANNLVKMNEAGTLLTRAIPEVDYVTPEQLDEITKPCFFMFPLRTLQDKVYEKSEILGWFGVEDDVALKEIISGNVPIYLKYGFPLSTNPRYYKMPIQYAAYESATQLKLVVVGLNTRDDVATKYEIILNLDGTIIDGNCNESRRKFFCCTSYWSGISCWRYRTRKYQFTLVRYFIWCRNNYHQVLQ